MMGEWQEIVLSRIISFRNGKKRPISKGKNPVYGGNGILGYTNEFNYNDVIIIGRVGAYCGSVYYNSNNCWVSDNAIAAQNKDNANIQYCYYLLNSLQLNKRHIGTSQPLLTQEILNSIYVTVPALNQQKKIASILSVLDKKIELNAQINRNLEAQARAIFKNWFIDFEPFRDGEFVDSELGPIPKGWSRGVLADIVDFCKQRIRVSELSPTTYISTENMLPNGGGIVDASSLPSVEYVTAFQKNDVLVSNIRPYFKKIWYCAFSGGCSNDVLCFSAKKTIPSEYIYSILNDEIFFAYVTAGAKGTKMPRGDKSQIMAYPVILPADSALKKFSELVRPMIARKRINEEESQYLSQLRDTLLPKLMSGEIDVSAVEV